MTDMGGLVERREDVKPSVKYWLRELDAAKDREKKWRERAAKAYRVYRGESERGGDGVPAYSIMQGTVRTIRPALYNSTPVPDVRRRFGDDDPAGVIGSQVIERLILLAMDNEHTPFDTQMLLAVTDMLVVGRGVCRIALDPVVDEFGEVLDASIYVEHVVWDRFLMGPGERWQDVEWVGFKYSMTRDDLIELTGDEALAKRVPMNERLLDADQETRKSGEDTDEDAQIKRAEVWQIWDRKTREVIYVTPGFGERELHSMPDPLELASFFPCPPPIYAECDPTSTAPLIDYQSYKQQEREVNELSERILRLGRIIKAVFLYDAGAVGELSRLAQAADGEGVAIQSSTVTYQAGGLSNFIYPWPIESLVAVLRELYILRDQAKNTIYEITGISDILRGSGSDRETTLGEQKLKITFGTQKIQERQRAVQVFCRSLMRMVGELSIEKLRPEMIAQQTQIPVPPQVFDLLTRDQWRHWHIDIETNSTILGDTDRMQGQASAFLNGLGVFMKTFEGPISSGLITKDIAADLLLGLARVFKLGKKAEDALERWGAMSKQPGPEQPDPAQMADQQRQQAEMQKIGMGMQAEAARHQFDMTEAQLEHQNKMAEMAMQMQVSQEELEQDMVRATSQVRGGGE